MSEESNEHIDLLEVVSEGGDPFFVLVHEKENKEMMCRAFHAFDSKEEAETWMDKMGFEVTI